MGVADVGDFSASLPLAEGKQHARFQRAGQPNLMGNHLYVDSSDGVHLCGLRTNNGTLDRAISDNAIFWRGVVRYTSYKLTAPVGHVVVMEDGTVGAEVVIYEGEALDFLPRAVFESRFAVCRPELIELAKSKLTYSDIEDHSWEPLAGNFGPSELPLPSVAGHDYENQSASEYRQWIEAWKSGNPQGSWESEAPRIGPRQPAGELQPYAHGGNGINPNFGYERSRSNILLRRWKHSRWMDRMNAAIFDSNGNQMKPADFPAPQQIAQIRGEGMWQWENELPIFLSGGWDNAQYAWFNAGPSSRREDVWAYKSVWISHYIRAIQHGIAVWEYTHDPMIADDLEMLFQHMRFVQFSDRGDEIEHDHDYTPPSIRAYLYDINEWPHQGSPHCDRAYGWSLYLGAMMHRMGRYQGSWLRKMISMCDKAMMPNGIVGRNYAAQFPEPNIQGIQTFHEMIIAIGFHAACNQMRRSPANKLRRMCAALLDNPEMPTIPEEYSPDGAVKGPPHWVWTHIDNVPVAITTEHSNGGGDAAHVSQVLALTFLATRDKRWLEASLQNWVVAATLPQKLAWLQANADKSWGGTLQAVLENQEGERVFAQRNT
jgi:hypothetical protein